MMLTEDEIPEDLMKNTKMFHFGTLSMTHENVRAATKKAIRLAAEAGAVISFDPNLRPPLWDSMEHAKEQVLYGLSCCQVLILYRSTKIKHLQQASLFGNILRKSRVSRKDNDHQRDKPIHLFHSIKVRRFANPKPSFTSS